MRRESLSRGYELLLECAECVCTSKKCMCMKAREGFSVHTFATWLGESRLFFKKWNLNIQTSMSRRFFVSPSLALLFLSFSISLRRPARWEDREGARVTSETCEAGKYVRPRCRTFRQNCTHVHTRMKPCSIPSNRRERANITLATVVMSLVGYAKANSRDYVWELFSSCCFIHFFTIFSESLAQKGG